MKYPYSDTQTETVGNHLIWCGTMYLDTRVGRWFCPWHGDFAIKAPDRTSDAQEDKA